MAERPEDLNLPASVVARIIKDALPDGVNVSKEARTAIARAASVFILYCTACSNNFALKAKRKTLNAVDVFAALEDMEFGSFIPELNECLEAHKQDQRGKKEAAADRKKKQQAAAALAATLQSSTTPSEPGSSAPPPPPPSLQSPPLSSSTAAVAPAAANGQTSVMTTAGEAAKCVEDSAPEMMETDVSNS